MGKLKLYLIIAGVFVFMMLGFTSLRSARPIVELKAESLANLGSLPILGTISLTNTMLTSWIVIIFIIGVAFLATRKMSLVPSGLQNLFEMAVEFLYNLVVNTAGEKHGRRFFPVIATIFFYVMISNWFGLLPGVATVGKVEPMQSESAVLEKGTVFQSVGGVSMIMPGFPSWPPHEPPSVTLDLPANSTPAQGEEALAEATKDLKSNQKAGLLVPFFRSVNTDLNSTLALAIISAIFVEFWGISTMGFFRYGSKFINVKNGVIGFFVGILEFIAEAARLLSFTFRLFGNIFAGEILVTVIMFMMPLVVLDLVYGLELFFGLIQAFIFAMLTLVFGVLAVTSHEGGEDHEGEPSLSS